MPHIIRLMTDPAQNYQTIQPVSTEGLEDLFQPSENHFETVDSHLVLSDSHLVLTVAEASVHLRMPVSTLYRRIRAGKFKTITGPDGALRIILSNENQVILTDSHSENQNVEVILTDSHCENQSEQSELARFLELLAEKDRRLEAATYRVGFLESQLSERQKEIEERDVAIKLLTDSQHKPSRWAQFKKWFLGQ
ncbi:MAG TPA: hypothetical protein V6C86_11305 [Oculatellaceae cyanobacterium]|jgi:hypothetical protein|nr:hypothetical protein [Nitrosomonas nitrosa]